MLISLLLCGLIAMEFATLVHASALHSPPHRVIDAPDYVKRAIADATGLPAPYQYKFAEFKPCPDGHGSNEQPYLAVSVFLRRSPNVTEDWFHTHYKTVHADITMRAKDIGVEILRYTQLHTDPAAKARAAPILQSLAGASFAPWDAISQFQTKDLEHLEVFIKNVLGNQDVVNDMSTFLDPNAGMSVMIGYENLLFGAAPAGSNGTNGILMHDPRLSYSTPPKC